MPDELRPDLCIIGAGSGGLSVAAGAAQMGADVVLIERDRMGGDCLNTGCVPSKALLAAAHRAADIRSAGPLGVTGSVSVDFAAVQAHVREVIAGIAPHDSVERFEGLGVTVIKSTARFTSPRTVEAGGRVIRPRRFVIATGSRPAVPPIDGLSGVPYLTNETVFDVSEQPRHLLVLGGGPIGCELGQAFRRLGSDVTIIEMERLLAKEDADLAAVIRDRLAGDGIKVMEGTRAMAISGAAGRLTLTVSHGGQPEQIVGTHILVATGRKPDFDGLDLNLGGIAHTGAGITVDAGLKTSNRRAYAIGDCSGAPQFTHVAGYHAGIVIRNALFRLPAKADHGLVPRVTYTAPELAQVGLTEAEARGKHGGSLRVLTSMFAANDRARTERTTQGQIKVICDRRGRILGAGIAGPHAGELIQPWTLALGKGLKIGAMATTIAPYPTLAEINKRAAGDFYTPTLFSPRTRAVVRFLRLFG